MQLQRQFMALMAMVHPAEALAVVKQWSPTTPFWMLVYSLEALCSVQRAVFTKFMQPPPIVVRSAALLCFFCSNVNS